ncbi:hypothetical protein PVAND_002170 [Polypedilum vanderplanki]|uniref:Uncharacterized protein n=1 Tax=Polypedilum vanderplanki TaxID=319348 RepID=A0A9J6BQH2_POLVA|nr:hypothetical protein PVAND_002170 [Polypedilum vanderplanki]
MNDSFGGGFTQSATDSKTESKTEGTLPVFIKMILLQNDIEAVSLFGQDHKMVNLVAVVKNIEHSSTKISYELEDFTGRITANLWIDEDVPRNQNIMINSYVRVIGGVRCQNSAKSIMVYKIDPVGGINEINTHYIEVVNARYAAEENAGGSTSNDSKMDVDVHVPNKSAGGDAGIADSDLEGLNAKERVVFKMIQGALETTVEGYHRSEVYKRFPQFSKDEIDTMLERMSTEGLIYTTVDTDHFQACF